MKVVRTNKRIIFIIASLATLILVVIYHRSGEIDDRNRKARLSKIDDLVKSNYVLGSCKLPNLPVNSPEMMQFVHSEPPIDCISSDIDWVSVKDSTLTVNSKAKKIYGSITCSVTDLIRVNDFQAREGQVTHIDDSYVFEASDVVKVYCRSKSSTRTWQSIMAGIRRNNTILERSDWSNLPADALKLNVLMFGFDSLSRNTVIRKLPKSYKYLTEVLGAQVLEGYNIVGDGTPQALIPILTGQTELELPDTRKRIPNTSPVDVYPFVWKDFSKHGYVTAFLEDTASIGTFTYRLNGFQVQPTDHYMRPYYVAAEPFFSRSPRLCYGATPRHKIMMNYIKHFFSVYKDKPKFLFGFHGELSHDSYNLIGAADDDVLEFFTHLKESGVLKDTILIFMADHGHRFASIRNTLQGKQEERMPFFGFAFPESFKTEHPVAFNNFKQNTKRLTSPFDIYPTLLAVLSLGNTGPADLNKRSVSLFSQVSEKRTCVEAYIEPHWCACLDWTALSLKSEIIPSLTTALITTLNNYTSSHRDICEILSLKEVIWVNKLTANDNLLHYKKNADMDGFVGDFTGKTKINRDLYQIKVKLTPGDSLFEASVTHFLDNNNSDVNMKHISRINKYGSQARCVEENLPHLRKYCYCKDGL